MALDGIAQYVTIETALGDDPFEPAPTWTDQHAIVEGATATAGGAGPFGRYRASTLKVQFDNTQNAIDMATWYRWRQVQLRTVTDSTRLAHGHIDEATYDIGAQSPFKYPGDLDCVDGVGLFARRELDDEPVPAGTTESVITYLASLAGLPTPTFVGMSSIPIAEREAASGNVLSVIQDVLDTESGFIVRQPQDDPLQLEVRGRYAPLVSAEDYADNGPICVLRGDPTAGADPPEVAVLRSSIPLTPASATFRDEVTGKGTSGVAYTQSLPTAGFPVSSFSRTDMQTANDNWVISTVDMWLKIYNQQLVTPQKVSVLCATAAGELPALAVVKLLRFGDTVELITPATGGDVNVLVVDSIQWRLTRQGLYADLGFSPPLMANIYGAFSQYATVGGGVVGTSKVAP